MTRIQIAGALLALALSAGVLLYTALCSPEAPFLRGGDAAWITSPRPVFPATHIVGPDSEPPAVFARRVRLAAPGGPVSARVRALGRVELAVNGRPVPLPDGERACLKEACRARVDALLVDGENEIRATVRNPIGPPVLSLRLVGAGVDVATDPGWRVAVGGAASEPAVIADDTRTYPNAAEVPTPLEVARQRGPLLLTLFGVSAALFLARRRVLPERVRPALPGVALAAATLFWLGLFAFKHSNVPLEWGFDGRYHVQFVRHVAEHGGLPPPSGGPAMYHPPLFHAAAAGLLAAVDPARDSAAERRLLKLLPFLSGLAMVWCTWAVARRVFADEPLTAAFAVLAAALLPLNLYMAAYVSNEPLFAALASGAFVAAAGVLLEPRPGCGRLAALAVLLGLALWTKYTALLFVAALVFFVGFGLRRADGAGPRRVAVVCGALLLGALGIGVWPYVRNWMLTGDPFFWNLSLAGGLTWWQPPGFRTAGYYAGFGEALRHPFFAGFHSFWDGVYVTLWSEGLPPTAYRLQERHGVWDYDAMALACLLALPATAVGALGYARAVTLALRGDDLRRRVFFSLVAALPFALGVGLLQVSLRYPVWGAVRSTYTLSTLVPLALCGALGASTVDRWLAARGLAAGRALFFGWLGAFAGVIALSFAG